MELFMNRICFGFLLTLICVSLTLSFNAQSSHTVLPRPDLESTFESNLRHINVTGGVYFYLNKNTNDVFYLIDFEIDDGVVLEVKFCGYLDLNEDSREICLSAGNLKKLKGLQKYEIPYSFKKYTKVFIYDLDLFETFAMARF
jgi:hypothetical protein